MIDYFTFLRIELLHCLDAIGIDQKLLEGNDPLIKIMGSFYELLGTLRYSGQVNFKAKEKVDALYKKLENRERRLIDMMSCEDSSSGIADREALLISDLYRLIYSNLESIKEGEECCPFVKKIFISGSASLSEKEKNSARSRRYIDNKLQRYKDRIEAWRGRYAANTTVVMETQSEAFNKYVNLHLLNSNPNRQHSSFKKRDAFNAFIQLLLVKYHIRLHSYAPEDYTKIDQHITTFNNVNVQNDISRIVQIFTFCRLAAKYFKDNFDPEKTRSQIIAKAVETVSYIRRGFAYDLLNKPYEAFNDFTSAEKCISKMVKLTNHIDEPAVNEICKIYSELLVPYIYSLKGELYRKEHAFYNAHQYFCGAVSRFGQLEESKQSDRHTKNYIQQSLKIVRIKREKAKTFLELGEFARSLKWYLQALKQLCQIDIHNSAQAEPIRRATENILEYFEAHRNEPSIGKPKLANLIEKLTDLLESIFGHIETEQPHRALFSDLLNRCSMVLYLLNLPEKQSFGTYKKLYEKPADLSRLEEVKSSLKRNVLAKRWNSMALNCNTNNSLAVLNELIINDGVENNHAFSSNLIYSGSLRDIIYRRLSMSVLREVNTNRASEKINNDDVRKRTITKKLLQDLLTYTDTFITRNDELYQYLMRDRVEKNNSNIYFYSLQRWSSINPAIPRPSSLKMKGGGYFIKYGNNGIAIDPGINFIENLYSEGFSIADIQYIIATHDHIDHTADIDSILSLHYRRCTLSNKKKLTLIANPSVSARYSFMINQEPDLFSKMELTPDEAPRSIFDGFQIEAIKVYHKDIASPKVSNSIGLRLLFETEKGEFTIGITGDTKYYENKNEEEKKKKKKEEDPFTKLLNSDILIVHINSATYRELKLLSNLSWKDRDIAGILRKIVENDELQHLMDQIKYSYGFKRSETESFIAMFEAAADDKTNSYEINELDGQHLFLSGVIALYYRYRAITNNDKLKNKLFVIAETTEEMGSYRHKVARYLNEQFDNLPTCMTSDIGFTIRVHHDGRDWVLGVKCSRCALHNDNTEDDIYHSPATMREVCIKREDDGLFYFCPRHDPEGVDKRPDDLSFIERLERYQPYKHIEFSGILMEEKNRAI